jgi:hypothetical protein
VVAMFRVREAGRSLVSLPDREGSWIADETDGQTYGDIETGNACDCVHE